MEIVQDSCRAPLRAVMKRDPFARGAAPQEDRYRSASATVALGESTTLISETVACMKDDASSLP